MSSTHTHAHRRGPSLAQQLSEEVEAEEEAEGQERTQYDEDEQPEEPEEQQDDEHEDDEEQQQEADQVEEQQDGDNEDDEYAPKESDQEPEGYDSVEEGERHGEQEQEGEQDEQDEQDHDNHQEDEDAHFDDELPTSDASAHPTSASSLPAANSASASYASPSSSPFPVATTADAEWQQSSSSEHKSETLSSTEQHPLNDTDDQTEQPEEEQHTSTVEQNEEKDADASHGEALNISTDAPEGEEDDDDEEVGDDEADEEEDADDEEAEAQEAEDEESEEEEPTLKYQRVGADVSRLLHPQPAVPAQDTARCFLAHSKFFVLGTASGLVYMLDINGNIINQYQCHNGPINDLSLDASGEWLASCGMDSAVVITNLYTKEQQRHPYPHNVLSVALPAQYKHNMMFATGSSDQRLIINKKGWFSNNNHIIHSGEGVIYCVRWRREFIAWANDIGVKLYDVNTSERIAQIKKDHTAASQHYPPHLCWDSDDTLLIGWYDQVKVACIKERLTTKQERALQPDKTHTRYVHIMSMFTTDYYICGIAAYQQQLLILGLPKQEPGDNIPAKPQLRRVSHTNEELSVDELPIRDYQKCTVKEYHLAYYAEHMTSSSISTATTTTSSASTTSTTASTSSIAASSTLVHVAPATDQDCLFFIVAPHDVIVAKPRDADDHISYLLSQQRYKDAVLYTQHYLQSLATHPTLHTHTLATLVDTYLHYLFDTLQDYATCATECAVYLGMNAQLWESWILLFIKHHQLHHMIHIIPTFNPQLSTQIYQLILFYFLQHQQYQQLLTLVTSWNKHLYDPTALITQIKALISQDTDNQVTSDPLLLETLAELYLLQKQYSSALSVFIRLQRHDIFSLITSLDLFPIIQDKILSLMQFDEKQTIQLLMIYVHQIKPQDVLTQLRAHPYYQYLYLHALFTSSINQDTVTTSTIAPSIQTSLSSQRQQQQQQTAPTQPIVFDPNYGDLLLSFYATYNRAELLPYLKISQDYNVDLALDLCNKLSYYPELIYLYQKIGNTTLALTIIIEKLQDVKRAILFVEEEKDDLLWDTLITYGMSNVSFLSELLMNVSDHYVDLSPLIQQIPDHMVIDALRTKLLHIFTENTLQLSVMKGGHDVMKREVEECLEERRKQEEQGMRVERENKCEICTQTIIRPISSSTTAGAGTAAAVVKSKRRPRRKRGVSMQSVMDALEEDRDQSTLLSSLRAPGDDSCVIFFCGHCYHKACLIRAMSEREKNKPTGDPNAASATGSASSTPTAATSTVKAIRDRNKNFVCLSCLNASMSAGWKQQLQQREQEDLQAALLNKNKKKAGGGRKASTREKEEKQKHHSDERKEELSSPPLGASRGGTLISPNASPKLTAKPAAAASATGSHPPPLSSTPSNTGGAASTGKTSSKGAKPSSSKPPISKGRL